MNRGRQGIIEASLSRSFFYSRRAILADNGANTLMTLCDNSSTIKMICRMVRQRKTRSPQCSWSWIAYS